MLPRRRPPRLAVLAILLSALPIFGCGPSEGFKTGISSTVPMVVERNAKYIESDAALPERETRRAENEALRAAVSDRSKITLPAVELAWTKVKPSYMALVNAKVSNPDVRDIYLDTPRIIDDLIAAEKRRSAAWFWPF